jgi:hypothetical protein
VRIKKNGSSRRATRTSRRRSAKKTVAVNRVYGR